MRQLIQHLDSGTTELVTVPDPQVKHRHVLIATQRSLISPGTERMLVSFGQAHWFAKARAQPEKVQQVLDKMRTDGILATLDAVRSKLGTPLPLGYCNVGRVMEIGPDVIGFRPGDRVVSNGPHAELVSVSQNLCAKIPDQVSDDEAAFAVLAAVGLQGIRLARPDLGESVAVIGLGLIGLLTVQMLLANGCRVIGFDLQDARVEMARRFGAEAFNPRQVDPVAAGMAFSYGQGLDAVLITASTRSSDPVHQAAQMSRQRGRIILVGVTGLELRRSDFYEKELSFQVSCSYGPGRYDPTYEEKGQDYPYGLVRWTAQRNFEAVLEMMAQGKLNVQPLISRRVPLEEAPQIYQDLASNEDQLGILLTYPSTPSRSVQVIPRPARPIIASSGVGRPVVGVIGAGNFAQRVLLPALSQTDAQLRTIAASGGLSATLAARKFGFYQAVSDPQEVFEDPEINTIFILTRHQTHAPFVIQALEKEKHVFVEKPLALNRDSLAAIRAAYEKTPHVQLMVGFNRRFAPLAQQMRALLAARTAPLAAVYTVNAGAIPPNHWIHDLQQGGGRVVGEGCHFVDFLRFLVGSPITEVTARAMLPATGSIPTPDTVSLTLTFQDGSLGVVHYFANGSKQFPKERVEVFCQGQMLVLDNFKRLRGYGWPGFKKMRLWRQDKGHQAEVAAFVQRVREGGPPLIPWQELEEVTLVTLDAMDDILAQKES